MLERAGILEQRARKVLVIDDDQDFADSLANLLTLEGYVVERAYSAAAAHAVLAGSETEVALIDIRLGESSGIELIAAFRRRRPDIICVMMTAYASVETAIEALQQGAYDYLCKPFFTEDLLATLERCFDRLTLARERDAVEAALRRRNQELEQTNARLHRVVQSMQGISGCLTLGELQGTLLEEVVGNLVAAGGAIWLRQGDRLVRTHAIGDAGTAGGAEPDEPALEAPAPPGGSSSLALPLRRDGGPPIGFVSVHAGAGRTFGPQDQELALILTSFGGQAIRVLEALESLRRSEERLRRITENSPSAISLRDREGRFLIVNRQFEAWHGVGAGVAGRAVGELLPPGLARLYGEQDRDVLAAGQAIDREVEMPFSDGTVHAVLMTTFPVQDGPGAPIGVGTIGTDVSAHVRAQEQLRQAQKMEALGQLTGGVAHDFNNLLAVILGNLELLQEGPHDDGEVRELIGDALESARSGVELTHRLLAFGRRQTLHPQPTDLRQLIFDMSRLLERTLGETIEVVKILPDHLWSIEVDRNQVETSLLNLAINARDAMPDGGTLTIEAANVDHPAVQAGGHDALAPGRYVMVAVGDTGVGMPPAVVERAFQPFFTTKDVGQGSGLGLSMVYGFVKQSGGSIEIASEPGRGSTLRLYLPRATTDPVGVTVPHVRRARGRGETILVVEDRSDVRKLACKILGRLGYRVLAAADGRTALSLLQDRPAVDLMLADVVLPGRISGMVLAREASARHPHLKILYTSGYAPGMAAEGAGAGPAIRLIKKPFHKDELAAMVRSMLDGTVERR